VYLRAKRARKFEATPTIGAEPRPFQSFLKESTSPTSPIDLFSNKLSSKHAKVSHSSIFFSSVAREGFPFSLSLTATQ
jgi:hypothetical protein